MVVGRGGGAVKHGGRKGICGGGRKGTGGVVVVGRGEVAWWSEEGGWSGGRKGG